MKIGFIGLGNMGAAIAANLIRGPHEVVVWNRSPDKARPLLDMGAKTAATPRELAADSEVVFSMLADDAALRTVLDGDEGLLAGLAAGAIHVSLSTIGVAAADAAAAGHAARRQGYISAPVFGRPAAAASAKLFIVAAGDPVDLLRVQEPFKAISQGVFTVGDKPSSANVIKLCGNFMILAAIESLAEAMALADRSGVLKRQLLDVLCGTLFDTPLYRIYGPILIEGNFRPAGFAAPLGLKDMRLVGAAAEAADLSMPFLDVLDAQLQKTIAREGSDIDWSGIAKALG